MLKYRKLRLLTKNNKTGDSFGITIPKEIAHRFQETGFFVYYSRNQIILESGTQPEKRRDLYAKEADIDVAF